MRTRAWRVVVLAFLAGVVASGCKQTVKMRVDGSLRRVRPVLSPGDVIEWDGIRRDQLKWRFGENPCDPSDLVKCKIRKGTGGVFNYECPEASPCDPEIAVDETGGTVTPTGVPHVSSTSGATSSGAGGFDAGAVSTAADIVPIWFHCSQTAVEFEPEHSLHVGDVVSWTPHGLGGAAWQVTFTDQMATCGNTSPISQNGGSCKLQVAGNDQPYTFKLENTACNGTTPQKLTVQ
jgi:hypothetical protein